MDYIFKGSLRYTPIDEKIGNIVVEKIEENKYKINCSRNNLEIIATLTSAEESIVRFYHLDFGYYSQNKITNALKAKMGNNLNYYISEYTIKDNRGFSGHYKVEKLEKVNIEVINPLEQ